MPLPHFRIRTLMIAVAVLGLALAPCVMIWRRGASRHQAISNLLQQQREARLRAAITAADAAARAAAYAEAGDFKTAIVWQEEALKLTPPNSADLQKTEDILKFYRQRGARAIQPQIQ